MVDCVTALRYKKLTNEEGLGRKERREASKEKEETEGSLRKVEEGKEGKEDLGEEVAV